MREYTVSKKKVKVLNSLASHEDITLLKLKFEQRTDLKRKRYEIRPEIVSMSTYPNITNLTKGAKQALASYVIKYVMDEVSDEKLFRFSLI